MLIQLYRFQKIERGLNAIDDDAIFIEMIVFDFE